MPFRSQSQRRYLFATNPAVAEEFAAETPKGAKLPEHVAPKPARPTPKKKAAPKAKKR